MNFEAKSSVKVAQTPGGNSSFSIGWGENVPMSNNKVNRNVSSIVFDDGTKEPLLERRKQTAVVDPSVYERPTKVPVGGVSSLCFGGGEAPTQAPRVRVPPGGKSTFTLG